MVTVQVKVAQLEKLKISSIRTTWFHKCKKITREKLKGVFLIHDNAGACKCKLINEFLETETVVQLHNPPYSPDSRPCDFFMFTVPLKQISLDGDISLKVRLAMPLFSVYGVCPKNLFYCIKNLDIKTRN